MLLFNSSVAEAVAGSFHKKIMFWRAEECVDFTTRTGKTMDLRYSYFLYGVNGANVFKHRHPGLKSSESTRASASRLYVAVIVGLDINRQGSNIWKYPLEEPAPLVFPNANVAFLALWCWLDTSHWCSKYVEYLRSWLPISGEQHALPPRPPPSCRISQSSSASQQN